MGKTIPDNIVYAKLKSLCAERFWHIVLIIILNIMVVGSSFFIAYTIERLFDREVTIDRLNYFVVMTLLLLVTFVVSSGLRKKLVFDVKEMLSTKLQSFAIRQLMFKQQQLFDEVSPSSLHANVDHDINAINVYLHFIFSIFVQSSGTLLCGLIYLLSTNLYMTLVSVVVMPVLILVIFRMSQNATAANNRKRNASSLFNSAIIETLSGIESIKIHKMEKLLGNKIESKAETVYIESKKLHFFDSIISIMIIFGGFSSVILVLWVGGQNVITGSMSSGELVAFVMVLLFMSYSFASISDINSITLKAKSAMKHLNFLLQPDYNQCTRIKKNNTINGDKIALIDLSFYYNSSEFPALKNVSHTFYRNHIYSIVGRSGSGKSTLIKLISGLYYNYHGKIMLGEVEGKTLQGSKRATLVEQDPFFFSGTLWENITLLPRYTQVDEIRLKRASKLSNFDTVMLNNDLTFNSYIHVNAANLSGGEKQRLAIARALYSEQDILIFDEATNSLDFATEIGFHQHLKEISKDKIVLVVTHNLNNIYLTDQVVVVDSGHIVAADPPHKIISNKYFKRISKGNQRSHGSE